MSRRQILFLAHRFHEFNHEPVVRAGSIEIRSSERELYQEIRNELATFGDVITERASGIFPRAKTPPEGVNWSQHEARDRDREIEEVQTQLLAQLHRAESIVAVADGESETRGSLIERAVMLGKPVLLLKQHTGIKQGIRPLYHNRPGITFVVYEPSHIDKELKGMKNALSRFFQLHPPRAAVG
jgi:hypothetical protein